MTPLSLVRARIERAERLRKATPPQTLMYSGLFLALPIYFALGWFSIKYCKHLWDRAGALTIWFMFVLVGTIAVFGFGMWQRRVPLKIQIVSAVVAWLALIWMFFHFKFWEP